MAYIKPEEETEQESANQSLGQTQNDLETPQTVSGASTSTSTPTQTATPQPASSGSVSTTPSPTARSGIYTNLQDYIGQNQPAAQNIAGKATEKIEGQASQIGQQVQAQKSDFMNKVAENRTRLQQAQQQAQQQIQQAGQQEFDPSSIQQTQQLAQGTYQMEAPTFDVSEQQKKAQDVARMTDMGQTQQGRRELLTQAFRSPDQRYTQGQRSLDELVLAGDPNARKQIAEAPKVAADALTQQIAGAREQALSSIAGLGTEQEQIQSQIAQDIDAAQASLAAELQSRAAFGENINQYSQGNISQELLDALKLDQGRLYGINPEDYLRAGSVSQMATAEDLARARALQSLEASESGLSEAGIADASVVGTQDAFGIDALQDAVAKRRMEYENKLFDLQRQAKEVTGSASYPDRGDLEKAFVNYRDNDTIKTRSLIGDLTNIYKQQEALANQYGTNLTSSGIGNTNLLEKDLTQYLNELRDYSKTISPVGNVGPIIGGSNFNPIFGGSGGARIMADGGVVKKDPRKEALKKLLGK